MTEYKVWIVVEAYDTVAERGEDIELQFPSTRTFKSEQSAIDYATALHATKVINWRGKGAKLSKG